MKYWNVGGAGVNRSTGFDDESAKKLSKLRAARLAVVYGRLSNDRSALWQAVMQVRKGTLGN